MRIIIWTACIRYRKLIEKSQSTPFFVESDKNQSVEVSESLLREEKKLVKLTEDGHYMKDDDSRLITVDPERAAMAYK